MTNIKTGVEQRDPYEDGCLGGLKDNRHASKFKKRRENNIENWEDSVESIINHIKSKTENGKVAVVWSGVDADCVSWGNRVDVVSSSYVQIEKMLNDTYEGSEGSIDFYYEKPSIAEKLTETSRDLAMEAFEEGHPHVVYR